MSRKILYTIVLILLSVAIISFVLVKATTTPIPTAILQYDNLLPGTIDYNIDVKPILSDKCFLCHGPDKNNGQKAGLNLSNADGAYAVLKSGQHAIVPGKPGKSEMFNRIISNEEDYMMPTRASNRVLTDYEKAVLVKWISQGAVYKPHWAFIVPGKAPLPEVSNKTWAHTPLDRFVLHQLEKRGLQPSPEADKETLLRRVYLDITGLPPTVEEIEKYVHDPSSNAYEKVVDSLLASPQYGEKMAVDWLDLSRYADTHGYTVDRYRPMWPWRDWVIKAFNQNMRYDQFVTWQLAGDLLPGATREQRLATAFNRIHPQNMEGGIINEEFRNEYVVDRTSTFGTAFMGLTIGCARCHDHKFDPVSQKDFYSLYSFFNNIDEAGQISWDNAMPVPTMLLTEGNEDSLIRDFVTKEQGKEKQAQLIIQQEQPAFEKWKQSVNGLAPFDLTKGLQGYFNFDQLQNGEFVNTIFPKNKGTVMDAQLVPGKYGSAFKSNGDDILRLGKLGIFNRFQPFSIGAWINIPKDVKEGVIFHTGSSNITYDFRGYYLRLREGKIEFLMNHTWPYNNIVKVSRDVLPQNTWLQVTVTHDGSGKAAGIKLFLNGVPINMIDEKDNLYKDILFYSDAQPGLQIGAEERGTGFKNGLVDEFFVYDRQLNPAEIPLLMQWQGKKIPSATTMPVQDLQQYYFSFVSKAWQQNQQQLQELRQQRNKLTENIPEIMVMDEMKQKRQAHILLRGVYDAPGEKVSPGVPAAILPYAQNLRRDRLGLAQWLLDPRNPLTARVAVNRYWQIYFGNGLQKSADNFGNQGTVPYNPELLDWLAVTFRESGWNVKALQKMIVLSATYRQSSHATPSLLAKDPANTWLARGPSARLTAEMIRDAALKASGLLYNKIGGPSVKPYQPEGLWAVNSDVYLQDTGVGLYRRSIYTFWRRTNPPPSMNTFDAPLRSSCIIQRQKTSTPLQALVLLNDPQFTEASRVLTAAAMAKYSIVAEQISYCYRCLTGQKPSPQEMMILTALYSSQLKKFTSDKSKMKGWINAGAAKIKVTDPVALAAGTIVTSTIMNSDAFITKR